MQSPALPSASPALRLNLFGAFQLRVEGVPVTARHSRKESWLLALLALRHAQEVEREWLADTLWPDSLNSRALLRDTLSDLKRTLGSQSFRLLSPTPRTLRLDLEGAEVDVPAFDAALRRGDTAGLEQAVALYRGALLEGCTEEWVHAERQIREQQYLEALERLATLAQEAGDLPRAIVCWQRLVAADALRESARRGLMEALAARGDYRAAVQAYHDFRQYLHAELCAEPDAETTALLNKIRALARRPPLSAPSPRSADTSQPLQVPRPWNELVGRREELEEVGARLALSRLVTLAGTGGVGKTRLALHLAEARAQGYPDGVWFVDLAALTDPALVLHQAAAALGIPAVAGETALETLTRFLRPRRALLLLDNCEHLLEACALLTDTLLTACPDLRVLATSRQPLGIPGEAVWQVPPLSLPPARLSRADKVDPLATLMGYHALQLFAIRAGQANPAFKVTGQNIFTIAAICRHLDGLPLAIELAARTRSLPLESIAERLETSFRLLSRGSRAGQARQQTLQAAIAWSYNLLKEPEKAMLQQLSVFGGGWTLETAEQVCCGPAPSDALASDDVLDLLTSLADRSLVVADETQSSIRYRFLETIRQYAAERLAESGAEETIRERHRDCFLALAEQAEPLMKGPKQAEWLERLETEHDNLRAALRWCAERPDGAQAGLRLSGALAWFWFIRGYWSEGRAALETALSSSGAQGATPERAKALNGAGSMAVKLCDYPAARRFHEECLAVRMELGDRRGVGASYGNLGIVAEEQADYPAARANYERCLAVCREAGDRFNIAQTLCSLGQVARALGDFREAGTLFEESLALSREAENRFGICAACGSLGSLRVDEGEYAPGRALLEECLALSREMGLKRGVAYSLTRLGTAALSQNDLASARTLLEEGLSLFEELGARNGVADALDGLALLAAKQADGMRAARLWGASEALREALQTPLAPAHRAQHDRDVDAARSAAGEKAFLAAWAEGRAAPLEQTLSSISL